jgi:hypothetical protein
MRTRKCRYVRRQPWSRPLFGRDVLCCCRERRSADMRGRRSVFLVHGAAPSTMAAAASTSGSAVIWRCNSWAAAR